MSDLDIEAKWHSGDTLTTEEDRRLSQLQAEAERQNRAHPISPRNPRGAGRKPGERAVYLHCRIKPATLEWLRSQTESQGEIVEEAIACLRQKREETRRGIRMITKAALIAAMLEAQDAAYEADESYIVGMEHNRLIVLHAEAAFLGTVLWRSSFDRPIEEEAEAILADLEAGHLK